MTDTPKQQMIAKPQEKELDDPVTGWHVRIHCSKYFLVFSVNGRDFYIRTDNGEFDGTGSCVACN